MGVDRRRVVVASLSLLVSAGCLGESSLSTAFDLRIENQANRPRELSVVVDRVREEPLYDETPPGSSGRTNNRASRRRDGRALPDRRH